MPLYLIRLELARDKTHPEGSRLHGYEFYAPMDAHGHFDAAEWHRVSENCTLHRFWDGKDDCYGHLILADNGDWAFSYIPDEDGDDEPVFRLDRHAIKLGEYLTVSGSDGHQHTFRVVGLAPVLASRPQFNKGVSHGL